jgi:hypothetical protein
LQLNHFDKYRVRTEARDTKKMKLFNGIRKERNWKQFSLRRRDINDSKFKDNEEIDDARDSDGGSQIEDESSSILLLEITDEKSTYYEFPPPTVHPTNTSTAITNSTSSGTTASIKSKKDVTAAGKNALLNRMH